MSKSYQVTYQDITFIIICYRILNLLNVFMFDKYDFIIFALQNAFTRCCMLRINTGNEKTSVNTDILRLVVSILNLIQTNWKHDILFSIKSLNNQI